MRRRHCCFTKGRGLHSRQRGWRGSPANLVSAGTTWRRCHPGTPPLPARPPKLLDRVRAALRARHYSRRTEDAYAAWIRRFILFHGKRHPAEMGAAEVTQFLSWLAVESKVAASTQNQALSALLFLYRDVLELDLPWLDGLVRAKRPERLPVVLSREEVRVVLRQLDGMPRLMGYLLYGAGLRVLECCRLRVQDVDLAANQIVVRAGKGDKDRVTMLPAIVKPDLVDHLAAVRAQHADDLRVGAGWVVLPTALARKYPNAGREWAWQWVFPATRITAWSCRCISVVDTIEEGDCGDDAMRRFGRQHAALARGFLPLCHALVIVALSATMAWAQDSDQLRYYLSLRGFGSNPLTEVHDLFGASVGANLNKYWGVELSAEGFERRLRVNGAAFGEYSVVPLVPQVRLRYPLFDGRLTPYVIGGVGVALTEFNDRKNPGFGVGVDMPASTMVGTVGAGLEYFVADNVAAGLEVKYLIAGDQTVRLNGVSRSEDISSLYMAFGLRLFFPEHAEYKYKPAPRVAAQDGLPARVYLGLQLGAAFTTDASSMPGVELDPEPAALGPANYFIGGLIGLDIGRHLGVELTGGGYEVRVHSADRGSVGEEAIYAIIPQVRAKYPVLDGRLVPYAIGGVGAGYAEFNDRKAPGKDFAIEGTSWGLAATLGAGIEYLVASNIAAGIEARYLTSRGHTVKIGDGRTRDANFDAVLLTVGLRIYLFDLRF